MPRILKWDEKLQYIRPEASPEFNCLTPIGRAFLESAQTEAALEDNIAEIFSELWFCEHLMDYTSDYIDLKEVPTSWEI